MQLAPFLLSGFFMSKPINNRELESQSAGALAAAEDEVVEKIARALIAIARQSVMANLNTKNITNTNHEKQQ